ncbi:SGNH/GDSL hydrolase family protein [Paenibacillus doosanensis]|uniref:SGNH/GDSL hydrolase family protein n=1 Tax=Paenibacillus doosanensis TaxID=1229154 RepID=UPI00217F4B4E|nr:SGNH/GDSL hydrolase family protein [Paenibacillus doosanensis]MCS7459062.1 SGNH/GDSL hydrolase family protein [Paenibacillus doosanensis]
MMREEENSVIDGSLFANALRIERTAAGVKPLRFTERQMQLYAKQDNYRIRSGCPAGVCLDFMSDTESVELAYLVEGSVRNWLYFDIWLDGVMKGSIGSPTVGEDLGRLTYTLDAAEKTGQKRRWTIYFPHSVVLTVLSLTLSDGASAEPAVPYKRNLLCLGDSITQGMDAQKPSSTYPVQLSRALGMNVLNQGVGGYIFDAGSLDEELPYRPDLITVAYGTNDWGRYGAMEEFRQQCAAFFAKAARLYEGIPIFVVTPLWRADQDQPRSIGTIEALADTIREICADYPDIRVIDGQRLIPQMPAMFGDAYLHPNDEGFMHMTLNLFRHIAGSGV